MTTIDTAIDARCASCGYLLRGLPSEGKCPECAWPVEASRSSTIAHAAPTEWRRLMWGVWASALAVLLSPACIVGCFLLISTYDAATRRTYGVLLAAVFIATLSAHAWAAWALTTVIQRRLPHVAIPPSWPEACAAAGLLLLAVGSLLYGFFGDARGVFAMTGIGFAAITVGVIRTPAFYNMLADLSRAIEPPSEVNTVSGSQESSGYGQAKLIVEGGLCLCVTLMHFTILWQAEVLGCFVVFGAYGSLLFLALYPVVWLPAIFFHILLADQVTKRARQVTRAAA